MRILAVVLNLFVIVSSSIVGIEQGLFCPSGQGWISLWCWLLVATPIVSIICLVTPRSEAWLSLYFERKALEERQRITELVNKMEDKNA